MTDRTQALCICRQEYNTLADEVVIGGLAICTVRVRREVGVYAAEREVVSDPRGEALINHIIQHLSSDQSVYLKETWQ